MVENLIKSEENFKNSVESLNDSLKKSQNNEAIAKNIPETGNASNLVEKDFYTNLITLGPYVPADNSDLESIEDIPWLDKSLLSESTTFHKNYFAFEILTHAAALMFGLAVKPNSAVLLRTGRLHDPELSYQRFLSTTKRFLTMFNFYHNLEETYKTFRVVRKMHVLASRKSVESQPTPEDLKLDEPWKKEMVKAMRKDLQFIEAPVKPGEDPRMTSWNTWNPPVPLSQFDMATTQLGLWGTMWLFPDVFGIKNREKEMRGLIHAWALYGRFLGMRDEFNICIKIDPLLFDKMFREIVLVSLYSMDETVVTLQSTFMDSFSKRVPIISYKSIMYFGLLQFEGYSGENLWKIMSWKDKFYVEILRIIFWTGKTSEICRSVLNIFTIAFLKINFWWYLPSK